MHLLLMQVDRHSTVLPPVQTQSFFKTFLFPLQGEHRPPRKGPACPQSQTADAAARQSN